MTFTIQVKADMGHMDRHKGRTDERE